MYNCCTMKVVETTQQKEQSQDSDYSDYSDYNHHYYSTIPIRIVTCVQLLYNMGLIVTFTRGIFKVTRILQYDFEKYLDKKTQILILKVLECKNEYNENKCHLGVPLLQQKCSELSACINTDLSYVLKSKETAEIIAEILNSFFENLSNKTLLCTSAIVFSFIVILNLLLVWTRRSIK